jgi:ribosomal protein L12E/L44/L45/RPP1/RPP2
MTATITRPKSKKAVANKQQSPYKRLHVIIPIQDLLWASQQKPSVTQLWQECWTADPYGSRWMSLTSALGYSTFISAKKILSESGLFIFKPDKSIQDGRETASWMVKNLHGSRMKEFWEKANAASPKPDAEKQKSNAENTEMNAAPEEMRALNQASIIAKSQSEQGFCDPSQTTQKHLTNSSNELVRCFSDTLKGNSREEETAHAPLGGASPQSVQSVEELEEELPAVTDCTSLALVDAVQSESAPLLAGKQDCGVEPKNCHEGGYSAAPVAQNEFSDKEAIANQTQRQAEQSNSTPLLAENQECGIEAAVSHEEPSSAAPVSLNQSEIFEWLDRANVGECPPLWVIQYLLDSKYYASMRATISKFEKQWNLSVVNYQVQKSSDTISRKI